MHSAMADAKRHMNLNYVWHSTLLALTLINSCTSQSISGK